ncbi:rhamnose ABC transporter substrate-binding protein [Acidimangrovimonas sediminis]|uniref:rhamnose ABC transporter substrate-binding protein n=1 Tax=Acidimangrovimonas sediminis TaxID=2056283 RepID=UPI000C80C503|nr:rhamnose ABC transporter substrate-binding protein [Acidimangrovimonas sediminis]
MNITRKTFLRGLTTATLAAGLMMTTSAMAQAKEMRIAVVVKALGIGFFDAVDKGAEKAASELGDVKIIYTGPTNTTAEGQIQVINSLIAQHVDAIAISANDQDALVPVLKKAMKRGITVISFDSGVAKAGREMQLDDSSTPLIGKTLIKMAADNMPDGGEVAVLSASATATNQNAWIDAMKIAMKADYPKIKLVSVVYGDDLSDKSYRQAQGLIKKYPDLKTIIAPSTVAISAASQAVEDAKMTGKINVTGLGLPSQMAAHVKTGASKSFALWNPIDLGYAATMVAYNLAAKKAKAAPGAKIGMGKMGDTTLNKDNVGVMGKPFVFDASNVDKYAKMF